MNFTITISNTLDDLATAQPRVDRFLTSAAVSEEPAYLIRLCLEELVSNVIRHGHDDGARHDIRIEMDVRALTIDVAIEDDGRPFDPSVGEALEAPDSLETAPTGGMGLPLVRAMAGPIDYSRIDGRNRVTLRISL